MVSWVCLGPSLHKAGPIFIFRPRLAFFVPSLVILNPPPLPAPPLALPSPYQMFSGCLSDAHHAHGVGRYRLVAECRVQARAGGWCLIGL